MDEVLERWNPQASQGVNFVVRKLDSQKMKYNHSKIERKRIERALEDAHFYKALSEKAAQIIKEEETIQRENEEAIK